MNSKAMYNFEIGMNFIQNFQHKTDVGILKEKSITICVPSYNVERYLDHCLQTIVTCPVAEKLEVIVVDDGSTDRTAEIAMRYVKKYPMVVRLIQQENGGHGSTINCALEEANGRYFMVVDGDDWVDSDQLGKLLQDISDKRICSHLISSNYIEINEENSVETVWKQKAVVPYFKELKFDELDVENIYFTLASSLFQTDILRKTGMKIQERTFYVDVEYILFPIPYIETVTFVDYSIYRYRKGNVEQSVYLPTMVKRYDHHRRVMERVVLYRKNVPMTLLQKKYFDSILKQLLYTNYALFMIYAEDKQLSFAQGKKMDDFLCENSPVLAKWVEKEIPLVKVARRKNFDYLQIKNSPAGIFWRFGCVLKRNIVTIRQGFHLKNGYINLVWRKHKNC